MSCFRMSGGTKVRKSFPSLNATQAKIGFQLKERREMTRFPCPLQPVVPLVLLKFKFTVTILYIVPISITVTIHFLNRTYL